MCSRLLWGEGRGWPYSRLPPTYLKNVLPTPLTLPFDRVRVSLLNTTPCEVKKALDIGY